MRSRDERGEERRGRWSSGLSLGDSESLFKRVSAQLLEHPAMAAFVGRIGRGFAFGQLWIESIEPGFQIRHVQDRDVPVEALRSLRVDELREWSRFDAKGAFRPLKGAPDLRPGWICRVKQVLELEAATNHLYPGGIADWYSVSSGAEPALTLRAFLERQTGMYRGAKALEGGAAVALVRSCCGATRCLKRRLWQVEGMSEDEVTSKSEVPCLEPCAVLLDFARRESRMLRESAIGLQLTPMDLDTIRSVLERAVEGGVEVTGLRAGDTGEPLNPRRILLALEHLRMQVGSRKSNPGGPVE